MDFAMYVCLCRGITKKQVLNAIAQGARCNRDLNQCLGKTPDCGQCAKTTRRLMQQAPHAISA